jgi:hypothetical protein
MNDIKDGLYPVYVKDGVGYPVALTTEQFEIFDFSMQLIPGSIAVAFKYPMGKAEDILPKVKADNKKNKEGQANGQV